MRCRCLWFRRGCRGFALFVGMGKVAGSIGGSIVIYEMYLSGDGVDLSDVF